MKYLILIISIWTFDSVLGQLNKPMVGPSYTTDKKENFSGFVGETTTSLFTADYLFVNRKKQELIIRQFHKSDLQLVNTKDIYENTMDDYTSEPIEIYFQEGKFFLFSNYFGDKEKRNLLVMEMYNEHFEKLSFSILDTLGMDQTCIIDESIEGKGFVCIKYSKFSTLTEQEMFLTKVNQNGQIDWQKLIKSPLALQNLSVEEISFGERTPIYVLCNYSYEPKSKGLVDENDLINNKYAIWAYDSKRSFLKEFEVRLKDKWVNGVKMEINDNDELILSGFFNETRNHTINGVFSLKIRNMKVIKSSFKVFEDDVLNKFLDEKDRKKLDELPDYKLNNINILDNGSWFLTGEQYYKYIERSYDPRTNITTTTEHFNYNAIIVSYFDSLGNHIWTDKIPKYQNSTNDFGYYASFSVLNPGNKLFLFFNDSEKNNDLALDDYFNYKGLFNNRKFQITYVMVDPKGVQKRAVLADENNNFMLRAKVCKQINNEVMYLLGESGRQARLFAVTLEE